MGSKSQNQTSNQTKNTNNQLGNYGDGFQIVTGDNTKDNQFTFNDLSADVAMSAFDEVGKFAETAAGFAEKSLAINTQFADNAIDDAFSFASESNLNTLQFADNTINDAFGLAARASSDSAQLADNAIQSNDSMLGKSIGFIGSVLQETQKSISDVVGASQSSNKQLANSVLAVGESVQTGTTSSQKLVMNVIMVGAVGGLIMVLAKSVK